MKNKEILYGVIGFLLGALLMVLFSNNYQVVKTQTQMQTMKAGSHMMPNGAMMGDDMMDDDSMSMGGMVEALNGKTGDELDKAFLELMIEHHQGAVDMAKMLTNSAHEELKVMGENIISAQTTEIEQMKKWQIDWGYKK